MTAKEKEQELIEKFRSEIYGNPPINNSSFSRQLAENKKATNCAKIAIQEILDLDVMWHGKEIQKDYPGLYSPEQTREFWVEVMDELNK